MPYILGRKFYRCRSRFPGRNCGHCIRFWNSSNSNSYYYCKWICFDAVVVQDNVTLTVGSGQTQISQDTGGANHKGAISVERPSSTSTAMAWSTAATETWAIAALPVNINVSVALDIIQHKTNLVALTVSDVDHLVYTSTDGATWTAATTQITAGLMVDAVTAHEYIDAGLLASIGNELCAAVWHEDSGTITFFSSTNAGVAWADETIE